MINKDWYKKNFSFFIIYFISIIYTKNILFSPGNLIPHGLDFDSNLSPVASMLNGKFPWDDLWWLGFPDYAGPLSNIFYPISTLIFWIFGIVFGLKLLIFVHVLLSGIGFYQFSQYLTKNNLVRLYGSIVYMLSGTLAVKIMAGHLEKLFIFPWVPITLYFFYKYINDRKPIYIIFSSISASMFILAGDLYGALFFSFLFFAFFLIKIIGSKDRELIFSFLEIIILTVMISSIRIIPILFINGHLVRDIDVLKGLENILFVFSRFYSDFTEQSYGMWESYSFIGIIPFILFIIGTFFNKCKDKYYFLLFVAISFFWVQGNIYFIAKTFHTIPFINTFRIPTRIYMVTTFSLVSLSVLGLDSISYRLGKSKLRQFASIISCLIIFISFYSLYHENSKFLTLDSDQSGWKMYDNVFENMRTNTPTLVEIDDPQQVTRQHNFMENNIHYLNAGYGYSFDYNDVLNINGIIYSIADFRIFLSGTQPVQLIPEQYNNRLPFVFIIRDNYVIGDLKIERYQSGNILLDVGNVIPGDIIVLKQQYYKGWSVKIDNGSYMDADNFQNLVSYHINEHKENFKIQFLYIPIDLYIGLILMFLSIPFSLLIIIKNRKLILGY